MSVTPLLTCRNGRGLTGVPDAKNSPPMANISHTDSLQVANSSQAGAQNDVVDLTRSDESMEECDNLVYGSLSLVNLVSGSLVYRTCDRPDGLSEINY